MSALNDFTASLPNLAPKRPPRTLSVHDRKVNVDGLPPEPSMYLLAREWVANNPHKPTYVRPMLLAAVGGVQLPAPLPHTPHSLAKLSSGSKRKVSELSISSSRASAELILEQHVEHARDVRRWVKVQRQANLERFRPRLLKLLCGGQGLQQANMPMPVQPNMPEAQSLFAPRLESSPPGRSPRQLPRPQLPSAAEDAAAEAARATVEVIDTSAAMASLETLDSDAQAPASRAPPAAE